MTIGLISARGGSTRVPRKNLALVGGLPLVAWSIIQSINSLLIDETWLTTDDDEIADVGRQYGARIVRRPVMDSGVTVGVPFLMALKEIEGMVGRVDDMVTILPTSPLRTPDQFDRMLRGYRESGLPCCNAVPQKETYIYRLEEPYQDRFATMPDRPFAAHQLLGDKFWNYAKIAGGDCAGPRDWFHDAWANQPRTDLAIDIGPVDTARRWCFVALEEWQSFEVDYPADLELVRALFDHYVKNSMRYYLYKGQS